MNFLAHLYLSDDHPDLMIGNFIADAIRKVQWQEYEEGIIRGVKLHHFIDDFTDSHAVVRQSKQRLYDGYGKYAPVIIDIFYDHFLAKDWEQHHHQSLKDFTDEFYTFIQGKSAMLPERINYMIPYMVKHNWLYNYQYVEGIHSVLGGMSRRTPYENNMHTASVELERHFEHFEKEFYAFFPELKEACEDWLRKY